MIEQPTPTFSTLLYRAVGFAKEALSSQDKWPLYLDQLDRQLAEMDEQIANRKSIPPELSNAYREEIDAVTLENTLLVEKLTKTTEALTRAKRAYKEEREHANVLEERLGDLEQRLVKLLRKEA